VAASTATAWTGPTDAVPGVNGRYLVSAEACSCTFDGAGVRSATAAAGFTVPAGLRRHGGGGRPSSSSSRWPGWSVSGSWATVLLGCLSGPSLQVSGGSQAVCVVRRSKRGVHTVLQRGAQGGACRQRRVRLVPWSPAGPTQESLGICRRGRRRLGMFGAVQCRSTSWPWTPKAAPCSGCAPSPT
jgi:hypothetical protein